MDASAQVSGLPYLISQHEGNVASHREGWCSVTSCARQQMCVVLEHGREVRELGRVYEVRWVSTGGVVGFEGNSLGSSEYDN